MLLNRFLNKPKLNARLITTDRKGTKTTKEATLVLSRNRVTRWRIAQDRFTTIEIEVKF